MAGATSPVTEETATLGQLGLALDTLRSANEIDIAFVLQGKGDDAAVRANYIGSNIWERVLNHNDVIRQNNKV